MSRSKVVLSSLLLLPVSACHHAAGSVARSDPSQALRNCVAAQVRQAGYRILRQDGNSLVAASEQRTGAATGNDTGVGEMVRVVYLTDGFSLSSITTVKDPFTAGPGAVQEIPPSPRLRGLSETAHRMCGA